MTTPPPGDQARATVHVNVSPEKAFRVFTEQINKWWRRGLKYRVAGNRSGVITLEPGIGGRLCESFDAPSGRKVIHTGTVLQWEPPRRVVLEWRAVNFAPDERTEVEVTFEPTHRGTSVTVTHRGWRKIRPDHPARHGMQVVGFIRMMGLWWGELLTSLRVHMSDSTE